MTTPSIRELTDPNAEADMEADNQPYLCCGVLPCVTLICPWCISPSAKACLCSHFMPTQYQWLSEALVPLLLKAFLGLFLY